MQDIDEKIRQALTEEDQKVIDELDRGTGLFELIGMSFKGKQAWMMYYMYFLGIVITALFVYFGVQYLATPDIKTSLTWAIGMIICLFIIMMIKLGTWQQMSKLELLRELKRLEMRLMLANEKRDR